MDKENRFSFLIGFAETLDAQINILAINTETEINFL